MSRVRLIHGDALEMLATLDAESFDACLTDPPYGIRFMGRRWDHGVPSSEVWREVLRCLRPGASLMAFGGTRTYHRLAVAVEDAGFEIRDSVLVPGVVWIYGSGFPKSLDLSKAIDTMAGADREVVARRTGRAATPRPDFRGGRMHAGAKRENMDTSAITAPATPEAARWEGYGTAVKPSWEPVVWAMKPVDGTFAQNALEHGVAGVNVNAGRVGTSKSVPASPARDRENVAKGRERNRTADTPGFDPNTGRFPANLILAHLPGCRPEGTRKVKPVGATARGEEHGKGQHPMLASMGGAAHQGYRSEDGTEDVPAWQCAEGCAVLAMDRASGVLHAPMSDGPKGEPVATYCPGDRGIYGEGQRPSYTDSGTASRFFKQVSWEPGEFERTLLYYAKAPTAERMVDSERLLHPTMKPLALVTYLAKLLLPPPREDGQPRRLLVPFSGVGSEVIGALRAGWDEVVAIELDADGEGWIEKSARRIEADAPLFNEVEVVAPRP